jgi:hypothetical protein
LPTGSGEASDDATSEALTDAFAAYNDILGRVDGVVDLGSGWVNFLVQTLLTPGLYKTTFNSSSTIGNGLAIRADLTLSGAGVYIFQISSDILHVSEI